MDNFNDRLKDYIPVNERVEKFWKDHPNGRIVTDILKWENGVILMKAEVYRDITDQVPAAIGHAYEKEDAGYINKTSAVENCETSAVGRALAILGYEIKKALASREEMERALRQQETIQQTPEKVSEKVKPLPVNNPASEAQKNAIKNTALKLLKYKEEDLQAVLTELYGKTVEELDKKQASEFIGLLNKEVEKKKQKEAGAK